MSSLDAMLVGGLIAAIREERATLPRLKVGDTVTIDRQRDCWGKVEAVTEEGSGVTVLGIVFSRGRLTLDRPRCGELRVGSAMSRRGTNQHVVCGAAAKMVVTLLIKGEMKEHDCCGWHSKALLKSPLYVSHRPLTSDSKAVG